MLINAATYVFPIFALVAIRVADVSWDTQRSPLGAALSEGITTLWQRPTILGVISLMAVVGGLAWPVYGLMPAFAEEVIRTGSVGLGLLLAVGALGSIIGTVAVARLGGRRRGRSLVMASLLLPGLVVGFAASSNIWLAGLFLVPLGITLLIVQSLAVTLVQIHIADRVRGRVMSLYSMLHAGSDTVGNVLVGSLAVYAGLPLALALGGLTALLFALALSLVIPSIYRLD